MAPARGFFVIGKEEVIASVILPVEEVAAETGAGPLAVAAVDGTAAATAGAGMGEAFAATVVVAPAPDCGE